MRTLIIGLVAFLAACNGSDNDSAFALTKQLPPNESTQIAALQAEVSALQASVSKLQLIGKVHGVTDIRSMREPDVLAANFGPCTDMGVLIGRSGGSNAMTGNVQSFQTCSGYEYSVDSNTGIIEPLQSMEWDGPNCTGNVYAPFADLPLQTVATGAVFTVPTTGTIVMVVPGTQMVHPVIVSVEGGGVCQSLSSPGTDVVYPVVPNDTAVSGVPNSSIPVPYVMGAP